MAQYVNLKDYFQGEHFELIGSAIKSHLEQELNSECRINTPVVRSLVCTNDDAKFNVEYELGVSAEIIIQGETQNVFLLIHMRGNLERKLKDIEVISVKSISEDDFPEDNLLSQFILPDLPENKVERIGSEMIAAYKRQGVLDDCQFSIAKLIEKEPIYFSPLPANCLGRIMLAEADVEVVINNLTAQHQAIPSTILLNKKKYADELDGSLMITVAHELAHWWFHQRFFKVLLLLGEDHIDLKSSTDMVALNDNMTDVQKALCIAEWQADVLAIRLAIPAITVDAAIQEIANDPSTQYANYGDRMQACVNKFAKIYNVSPFVAKERLRQLGYDFVDGTCIEYEENGNKIQPAPFYFQPRTLKGNETFVIDRENYERLLRKSKDFSELINSGRYIYLGYVVCLVDQKYVDVIINEDGLGFHLTTYAREHADECCIKFAVKSVYNKCEKYINYGQTYLSSNKNELLQEYEACISDDLKETINSFAKEDSRLNSTLPYGDALAYYLFEDNKETAVQVKGKNGDFSYAANRIIGDFAERTGLSITMIKKYLNNCSPPKLENTMRICFALGLDETQSRDMIKKAGHYIDAPLPEKKVCRLIFRLSHTQAATILENWEACVKHFKETTYESTSLSKL